MKKNKWIILTSFLLLGSVGLYIFMTLDTIPLKSDVLTSEYGDAINFEDENILDTDNPKILDSLIIDQAKIDLEENQKYPKVGKYLINVTYTEFFRTHSQNFTLVVSDTTKPTFTEAPSGIEITDENPDFQSYFEVEDLSEFELEIDTSLVDFEKEGIYSAKAVASDIYGNEAIHNFYIEVKEEEMEQVKQEEPEEETKVESTEEPTSNESEEARESEQTDEKTDEISQASNTKNIVPTIKNGILIVNKKHPLPANYSPGENPEAVAQLQRLISEMQRLGYDIGDYYSGFRSYNYQKSLYERYVSIDGKEAADMYSARPGHSEHQTGLTFDLTHTDGTLVKQASEAKWISENASKYGFIVRYQAGKEEITGCQAEPWHLRYVGDEAISIYNSGLALEEYLGVEGGDYYND